MRTKSTPVITVISNTSNATEGTPQDANAVANDTQPEIARTVSYDEAVVARSSLGIDDNNQTDTDDATGSAAPNGSVDTSAVGAASTVTHTTPSGLIPLSLVRITSLP
jgi:hypothetical protein